MESLVTAFLPLAAGEFEVLAYPSGLEGQPHLVLKSVGMANDVPLIRVHSECWTGDVAGSLKCDCGPQLHKSLDRVSQEGGAVIYLRQEGRGIGLVEKLKAYNLQEKGMDTFEANEALGHQRDGRDFGVASEILKDLGWRQVRLLTNNPDKVADLKKGGVEVVQVIPLEIASNAHNMAYMQSKAKESSRLLR